MRLMTLITAIAFLTSCTFTMVGNALKTDSVIANSKTVNATFSRSEQFINACSASNENLAEIRFHTNPVYLLAGLLSLGLYVPQNVTWWCGSESPECADGDDSGDCETYVREDD